MSGRPIASRTLAEWEAELRSREISVGPVLSPAEAVQDPLVRSLGLLGDEPVPSMALPLSGIPTIRHITAPELGADGERIRAHGWQALESRGQLPSSAPAGGLS